MEQNIVNNRPQQRVSQSDDQQGRQLFDDLSISQGNPFENIQLSSELKPSQNQIQSRNQQDQKGDENDFRVLMRKSKKQKNKQKKMRKMKQARNKRQNKKENINQNTLHINIKKHGKKMTFDSQQEQSNIIDQKAQNQQNKLKKTNKKISSSQQQNENSLKDSEQSSSHHLSSSESDGLANLNPNQQEKQQSGRKLKKRLDRKSRIMKKQGFDLKQLGNDGDVNYQLNQSVDSDDDSYSEKGNKKKGKRLKRDDNRKQKKQKLTNQQLFDKLKEIGCQEEVEQNDSERQNYDSGINQVQKIKCKKQSKNTIKIQNRLFGNIQMQLQQQFNQQQCNDNGQEVPQQKLELQFKPRVSSASSRTGSFLNKVEAMKKHRGLQADIDQQKFQRLATEKAKRSISQLVSKFQNEMDDNQQIDIQIKAPIIAKGKSGDLINNTMFIVRSLSQKGPSNAIDMQANSSDNLNQQISGNTKLKQVALDVNIEQKLVQKPALNDQSNFSFQAKSKKGVSRSQFFKQIKDSINVRRSKYVSAQQLKNSFKASKLQELEEIRMKIQSKKRKQAMYELGQIDEDDAENVINQLEQQVARKGGISKDDLRKLLRDQEGLQQLGEYDQNTQDKKKNKKSKNDGQKSLEGNEKTQQKAQQINKLAQSLQKISKTADQVAQKMVAQRKNAQISKGLQSKIQKIVQQGQQSENKHHLDDIIEEYEGEVQNQDMDIEQLDQQHQKQMIDQEEQQESQSESEQQDDSEADQSQAEKSQGGKKQKQPLLSNIQDQYLRKQLEDEGIIMPGAKKSSLNHDIDLSHYVAANQNGQLPQITFVQSEMPHTNPSLSNKQQTLEFKQFKKLRKIAVVIQQKKKNRQEQLKRAKQYFQQEAELGSDNEENDDNVKAINKKEDDDEYDGDDLDQELQELIDNAVDINQANEQEAFKKYMEDVKQKDREELQKILRGEFRRPNHDQLPQMAQMEEDEKNRVERMQKMVEWMQRREEDQKQMYMKDQEDDQMNYYYDYNGNRKKIIDRRLKNDLASDAEETPEQDDQIVQRKLQFYLMDTISPSKIDTDLQIHNQFILELPTMSKKNSRHLIGNFGRKNTPVSEKDSKQIQSKLQRPNSNVFNFAGSLLNLANKNDASKPGMPKMKKASSHMSEYLNKNKSHKPSSFKEATPKMPSIFKVAASSKK